MQALKRSSVGKAPGGWQGLGWVDVHLLTSTKLDGESLWTLDRPLAKAARMVGVPLVS